jgi:TIR domain
MDEVGQGGVGAADAAEGDAAAPFRIFINYRREDAPVTADWLYEALRKGVEGEAGFAEEQIFKDIDTIEPGLDFRDVIREAVESSDVFLAVIGPKWLTVVDDAGRRRLENPADYVRLEIEAALERAKDHKDVRVMPTLVEGATMPDGADLPEALSALVHRHAVVLTPTHRVYDTDRLVARLKRLEREKLKRIAPKQPVEPEPIPSPPKEPPPAEPEGGGRRWVALGGGALALAAAAVLAVVALSDGGSSDDSEEEAVSGWSAGFVPEAAVFRAAAPLRDGQWVAVGEGDGDAKVHISNFDSESTVLDGTSAAMHAVAVSESGEVAAGSIVASNGDIDAAIWKRRDDDPWTWTRVCKDPVCGDLGSGERRQVIYALAATPGGLIAVGADRRNAWDAAVWFSVDGREWSRRAEDDTNLGGPGNQVMNGVAAVGDRLVAVGWTADAGGVWISDDGGSAWRRIEIGSRSLQLSAVSARGSRVVAVGKQNTDPTSAVAWFSRDRGSTWERADIRNAAFRGQQMADALSVSSGWVAVGDDHPGGRQKVAAAVWRSPNGETWTPVSSDTFVDEGELSMMGVTEHGDGRLYVVGTGKSSGEPRTGRIWNNDDPE